MKRCAKRAWPTSARPVSSLWSRAATSPCSRPEIGLGAPHETGAEQHDAGAENCATHPAGERPLLLHSRLELSELEDALLARVMRRTNDQEDPRGDQQQAGDQ